MGSALDNKIEKVVLRENILSFEELLSKQEGAFFGDTENCPLTHHFAEGIYVREMFVPAGTVIVGKIHKHSHVNILVSGQMDVVTDEGSKVLTGPCIFISPPGAKKVGYALTDVIWINPHPNPSNSRDLEKMEKVVIAESFEEFEMLSATPTKKENWFRKTLNKIRCRISLQA